MTKKYKDFIQFSVYIPLKEYEKLKKEAERRMLSISAVAREKMLRRSKY